MNKTTTNELDIFLSGTAQMDIHGALIGSKSNGAKHPARVTLEAGGCPVNIARALRHGGYRSVVFSVQHISFLPWVASEVARFGATPMLRESDVLSASIILEVDDAGSQILVQRAVLRLADFDAAAREQLLKTRLAIAGPMEKTTDDSLAILRLIARLAGRSVLIPHPSLIADARFAEVASLFDCVIMNGQEAVLLAPEQPDIAVAARKLRSLTRDGLEILITNGRKEGLMLVDGQPPLPIVPHKIGKCRDVAAGDTFTGYYAEGRFLRGLEPRLALERALTGVALFLQARAAAEPEAVGEPAVVRVNRRRRRLPKLQRQRPSRVPLLA